MPLPAEIIDLDEYTGSINILIYGEPNVGKTTLVGQLENNLILATEQGTVSAARSKTRAKNVKVWEIKKWSDLEKAFLYLRDEEHPFKWVSIDSIPNMQQLLLRDLLEVAHKQNPGKYDLDLPQIQDHQLWQNKFKRFVADFDALPINTLWTATAQELPNVDGDPVLHPFLQGKKGGIARWVEAQPHIVAYYGKKAGDDGEVIRRLVFNEILADPDKDKPGIYAKSRYAGIFPTVVDIAIDDEQLTTLAELMAQIEAAPEEVRKAASAPRVEEDEDDDVEEPPAPKATKATPATKGKFRAVPDTDDEE